MEEDKNLVEKVDEEVTFPTGIQEETPSFLKRHGGSIIRTGIVISFAYVFLSAMAYGMDSSSTTVENYKPKGRKTEEIKKNKHAQHPKLAKLADFAERLYKASLFPWEKMGYINSEKRKAIRNKAFEIEGIDEYNPEHNKKRFAFYRKMGIAVREKNDLPVSITLKNLKELIEKKSDYRIPGWDNLEKHYSEEGILYVRGQAFFKADSKSEGGDEDGVANGTEWKKALNKMGYIIEEDAIEETALRLKGKDSKELKEEIKELIKEVKKNPDYFGNVPKFVPTEKLKKYIFSK
ncbi:MAG: hypothetical protein ISS23_02185 [Nanoarchaeota archaeon]|nr:hypothetical protein [Nanoarchaeota archaeon]